MEYSENDDKTRKDDNYSHRAYLAYAIDLMIEVLNVDRETINIDREKFIGDINKYEIDSFIAAILRKGVAILYDTGNRDNEGNEMDYNMSIFGKAKKLTEKQEKCISNLKGPLMKELYTFGIWTLKTDNNNFNCNGIEKHSNGEELDMVLLGEDPMDIGTFYSTLNIDVQPRR